jgi:His-Xaa-Ser system protein HxsD
MSATIASDKCYFDLKLDSNVYSLDVCKKASYALMDYISCEIKTINSEIIIEAFKSSDSEYDADQLQALLLDELLDYSLRESISKQTEDVKNIILSNAFSNTKLV